jgi:hypothetical protein
MNAISDGNRIRVYDAFRIKESIKEITGRFYDSDDKAWVLPYSTETAALLRFLGVTLEGELTESIEQETLTDEAPLIHMPIKATPYQHQVRAYNHALRVFGIGGGA